MDKDYLGILTEIDKYEESSPERLLFLSVIFQALLDATKEKTKIESSEVSHLK
jgi:hypothetical protein